MNENTDWIDEDTGYHCRMWDGGSHLCGYVSVPADHPLYDKGYNHEVEKPEDFGNQPIGKRGPINLFTMAMSDDNGLIRVSDYFDVHGSLTFGAAIKGAPARWYFGFDCAHHGDTRDRCDETYVRAECASLAKQLKDYAEMWRARRIARST